MKILRGKTQDVICICLGRFDTEYKLVCLFRSHLIFKSRPDPCIQFHENHRVAGPTDIIIYWVGQLMLLVVKINYVIGGHFQRWMLPILLFFLKNSYAGAGQSWAVIQTLWVLAKDLDMCN